MTEPDIEKKRKKGQRRRSARVYVNANKPLAVSLDEIAAHFPADPDDDGQGDGPAMKRDYSQAQRRRLAAAGHALANGSYPIADREDLENAAVLARTGHGDAKAAKKLIRRRARELGVPVPDLGNSAAKSYLGDPYPAQSYAAQRLSEPVTPGHQASSTGDHGVGQGRNAEIAIGHDTMRQHQAPTGFDQVISRMRTVAGDNQYGDRDITYTAGEVGLRMFNAAGQAGHYGGMQPVNPDPASRPGYGMARNSATPPTPGHRLSDPVSHAGAPAAMKASEAREVLRRHMFPGSGGGR